MDVFASFLVFFHYTIAFILGAENMPLLPTWIGEQLNQTIPVKLLVATNNWNGELTRSSLYLSFSVCLACGQVCCCFCCWGWLWKPTETMCRGAFGKRRKAIRSPTNVVCFPAGGGGSPVTVISTEPTPGLEDTATEYTELQPLLSGVHSVMRVKLALAGEGGECTPTPSLYIYHHQ